MALSLKCRHNRGKFINAIQCINELHKKITDHSSRFRKKFFEEIWQAFLINILENVGLEVTNLNRIKGICEKSTANIILNEEKHEVITPQSEVRQEYLS